MSKKLLILIFVFFLSHHAFADCSGKNENINISGNYNVQRDSPAGMMITGWVENEWSNWGSCTTGTNLNYGNVGIAASKNPLPDRVTIDGLNYPIYSTNLNGIGYIIRSTATIGAACGSYGDWLAAPSSMSFAWIACGGGSYIYGNANFISSLKIGVALVKYGNEPITGGGVNGGNIAYVAMGDYLDMAHSSSINLSSSVTITKLACDITSGINLSFFIGNVPADQFISPGTVSQQISTQNLGLNCDAGANINVTLNGTQSAESSDPSVLGLSPGTGVASGVGVQLLYNGHPLQLNKVLNLKTSSGGQESFPITARYIQTKETVTAGAANATATLNVIYQ